MTAPKCPLVTGITEFAIVLWSDVLMRKMHFLLVLLVGIVFGLSFAIPAEDLPDTVFDESESMPYESAPPLSIVLSELAAAGQVVPVGQSAPRLAIRDSGLAVNSSSVTLVILVHSLRC